MKIEMRWLIVMSFFICYGLNAQTPVIDSLKQLVVVSEDTNSINLRTELAKEYYRAGYASEAINLADSLKYLSQKIRFTKGLGRAWLVSGYAYFRNNEYLKALSDFRKAQEILSEEGNSPELARSFLYQGQVYDFLSEFDSAFNYYSEALAVLKHTNDSSTLSNIYNSIGTYYLNRVSYETAIEYFYNSLAISEDMKNYRVIGASYNNLGSAYDRMKQYNEAIRCYQNSIEAATKSGNPSLAALGRTNIGGVQTVLGNFDEAELNLKEALKVQNQINDLRGLVFTYDNFGTLFLHKSDLRLSQTYFEQSLKLAREVGDEGIAMIPLYGLSKLYFRKADYNKALRYLDSSQHIAGKLRTAYWLEQAYLLHSKIDSARNDYKGAYNWYKAYTALEDSLFSFRKTAEIARLKEAYEGHKKDTEIELLKKERTIQKIYLFIAIAASAVILLLAIILLRWYRLKAKRNREFAKREAQIAENRKNIEIQKRKLAEEQLRDQIAFKSKELTSYTLNLIQKNEVLEEIKEKLQQVRNTPEAEMKLRLNSVINSINYSFNQDKEWENFRVFFEQVHESFFDNLRKQYPDLTPNDLKLCALIKLNFPTKRIAMMLDISYESAKVARYRLRKKLDLATDQGLHAFLASL